MLVVSPSRSKKDEEEMEMESFSIGDGFFAEFTSDNLIDSIDFGDLFVGVDIEDGDVLPDLEMDQDNILAEFCSEESEINTIEKAEDNLEKDEEDEEHDEVSGSGSSLNQGRELLSKKAEPVGVNTSSKKEEKGRKSSKKDHQGKRKVKVDWTPELHRRFVQAVEQLGVDKAVPSRILELMGIDCLTRHNIASHLQKYRSHRKHLLAREAEAASWSQRRQMYNVGGCKREIMTSSNSPWLAVPPTIGFPPMHHHFRPLHVWGHPSVVNQSLVHLWPKHIVPLPTAPPPLPSPHHIPPPTDPLFWHAHHQVQNSFTRGSPYFPPQPLATPSKESIDAAIGDVLSKPWQPLPLGLKPPSLDSVMVELTCQGIQKIPPSCT